MLILKNNNILKEIKWGGGEFHDENENYNRLIWTKHNGQLNSVWNIRLNRFRYWGDPERTIPVRWLYNVYHLYHYYPFTFSLVLSLKKRILNSSDGNNYSKNVEFSNNIYTDHPYPGWIISPVIFFREEYKTDDSEYMNKVLGCSLSFKYDGVTTITRHKNAYFSISSLGIFYRITNAYQINQTLNTNFGDFSYDDFVVGNYDVIIKFW